MNKLKNYCSYLLLIALAIAMPPGSYAQTKEKPVGDSIIWMRNNNAQTGLRLIVREYSEDSYYGIEKIESKNKRSGYGIGSGLETGNGTGSGDSRVDSAASRKWVPYYEHPSNCVTGDYQPELNDQLLEIDEADGSRPAVIRYQPRPLYSKDDYLARRQGTIKLEVLLKADGTIGRVRPLSKLPGNLTQSAAQSACYLTFYPAVANGKLIDSVQTITYTFKPEQVLSEETAKYPPLPPANAAVRLISKPKPVYTPEARQNEVQGTVTLRVTFLSSSKIGAIVPVDKLADGLTEKAVEAAKQIRFEPARKKGRNITQTKTVQYNFTLY